MLAVSSVPMRRLLIMAKLCTYVIDDKAVIGSSQCVRSIYTMWVV